MVAKRFPVEASHVMMFARAVGDTNPVYRDPESPEAVAAGGLIAPPTFTMAGAQFDPANTLIPVFGEPWFGSGREPSGMKREAPAFLHAEQSFEYHRTLMVGEVLTASERPGKEWVKASSRGGELAFVERFVDYHNVDTGELVVTARFVGVVPSVTPA